MRYLITVVIAALSLNAVGQTDGWEYPFPYNPDGNADGYIALDDLMDFLALYGQEYPDSFYSDTTRAVLYLGEMAATTCLLQAEAAGSDWRMMTIEDLPYFLDLAVNTISGYIDNGAFWLYDNLTKSMFWIEYHSQSPDWDWDPVFNADNSASWKFEYPRAATFYHTKSRCLLVSEVRPEYEYSSCVISGSLYDSFDECVTSKLNDGWIPMAGGVKSSSSSYFQGFWRFVQD